MGCPCTENKPETEWKTFSTSLKAQDPDWHIVVVSAGKSKLVIPLMETLRSLSQSGHVLWTLVDTACHAGSARWIMPCDVRDLYNAGYVGLPNETNLPRAYNAGAARVRSTKWTLLLHDDVTLPDGEEWLCALEDALKLGAGIAVPHLTGQCGNPIQASPSFGAIAHSCEYIANAVLAFHTLELLTNGLDEHLDGYEWWQIDWQCRMARQGRATLVADTTIHHEGGGTYENDGIRDLFLKNLRTLHDRTGFPLDFKVRPRYPRANLSRPDSDKDYALCIVLYSTDKIAKVKAKFDEGGYKQICVVDASSDPVVRKAIADSFHLGNWYYAPAYDDDPLRQAINMSDYRLVDVWDLRPGMDKITGGRRIRNGVYYELPQRITDFHVGMLQHYALGDTIMMTPSLSAFKRAYPWINIHVHHAWDAAQLLLHNPDIDALYQYDMNQITPDEHVVDIGIGNGSSEMIWAAYKEFGLDEPDDHQAALRYSVQPEEHAAAIAFLEEHGVKSDSAPELVGVQRHGGWKTKQWAYTDSLIEHLLSDGKTVLEFGADEARMEGEARPNVIRVFRLPIRTLGALIQLLDVVFTFDSGIGYIASAIGTPIVSIWGTHKPERLLGSCGRNIVCLHKRDPQMCMKERGTSCEAQGNVSMCPFRENGIGADCLDEITPEDVMNELSALPRWECPIRDRQ